jgi:hypothetical protein
VPLTNAAPSATFTYTPASTGTKTISTTNSSTLTDPTSLSYNSTAPAPHLLNTLISYWKMDEGTGTTRNDSKGTNNLSDIGSVQGLAGKLNNGAYFQNGSNHGLQIANNSSLQVTGDFTFSVWVRTDNVAGTNMVILSKNNGTTDYNIGHSSTVGLNFVNVNVGSPATNFTWYHIVCWWDSSDSKFRMRINDTTTYVGAATTLATPSANALSFGNYTGAFGAGYGFTGFIDEVGFWKRKLNSGEITALYGGGTPPPFSSFTT